MMYGLHITGTFSSAVKHFKTLLDTHRERPTDTHIHTYTHTILLLISPHGF